MSSTNDYLKEITEYCYFDIEYDASNNTYKFNNVFVDEIKIEKFENNINSLKQSMIFLLKRMEKKEFFLSRALGQIKVLMDWYKNNQINKFSNFYILEELISKTENRQMSYQPKYILESIQNFDTDIDDKFDEIFYYLIFNKTTTNNYENPIDFEKVKLHFVVTKYFESLSNFIEFINSIYTDIREYGITNFEEFKIIENVSRCNSKLSKFQTIYLINLLFKNEVFYFDNVDSDNNKKLQLDFLNNNFKYTTRAKKLEDVQNAIKEYSNLNGKDLDTINNKEFVLKKIQSIIDLELSKK